jgi:hypothetical protein
VKVLIGGRVLLLYKKVQGLFRKVVAASWVLTGMVLFDSGRDAI